MAKKISVEKIFQAEIFRWRDFNKIAHLQRIVDMPWMAKRNNAVSSPFQFKKPYDLYWLENGNFHAIELKYQNGFTWNFSKLDQHQYDNLLEVDSNGGFGWIIINFRKANVSEKSQEKYKCEENLNLSFAIPIVEIENLINDGVTSCNLEWCRVMGTRISKVDIEGKQGWALSRLRGGYKEDLA